MNCKLKDLEAKVMDMGLVRLEKLVKEFEAKEYKKNANGVPSRRHHIAEMVKLAHQLRSIETK